MRPYISFTVKNADGSESQLRMFDDGTGGWYSGDALVREATADDLEKARRSFWQVG